VDQHDPNGGWSVAIPSPNSRDLQLVGAGRVLVSHPNGAAEYELAAGRKVWEITTYSGVHTARRLPGGNTLLGANAKEGNVVIANWLGHGNHPDSPHAVEFDRDNKLVWSCGDHKLAKVATNVMILDGRAGESAE